MGKYMRKGKGVGKLAVIEEGLGVRTRARALALQRDSKRDTSKPGVTRTSTSRDSMNHPDCTSLECLTPRSALQGEMVSTRGDYMELRSRRFEKVPRCSFTGVGVEGSPLKQLSKSNNSDDESSKAHMHLPTNFVHPGPGLRDTARQVSRQSSAVDAGGVIWRQVTPTASTSNSVSMSGRQPLGILTRHQKQALARLASQEGMDVEADIDRSKHADIEMNAEGEQYFGESAMVAGPSDKNRHRRTRESTPDSYAWSLDTPGSTSRTRRSARGQVRSLSAPPFNRANAAPSTSEIEAFFQGAEEKERRRFIERYNFDPVSERPLRGRFEWTST